MGVGFIHSFIHSESAHRLQNRTGKMGVASCLECFPLRISFDDDDDDNDDGCLSASLSLRSSVPPSPSLSSSSTSSTHLLDFGDDDLSETAKRRQKRKQ